MKRWAALYVVLMTCSVGCGSSVRVGVESKLSTNGGAPFYVMVRALDGQSYVSEDYKSVSAKVFTYPRDATVIVNQVVFPGTPLDFSFQRPGESDIALYFFFTKPGDNWRVPLNSPLPAEIAVDLGTNQIQRIRVRR